MLWTSILAIYVLVWVACAFLMLPFGIRTYEEEGLRKIRGQADSAPATFKPKRLVVRTTILAVLITAIYLENYKRGWIVIEDLNVFDPPSLESQPMGV